MIRTSFALAVIVVCCLYISGAAAQTTHTATPWDTDEAPWGLEAIDGEAISPERLRQALPAEFAAANYENLQYHLFLDPDSATAGQTLYPFAVASETIFYYRSPRPVDIQLAVVNI